jgi:hypothetical protein
MKDFAEALNPFLGASVPLPTGPRLSLRVLGTPFTYRPLPGQNVIALGRQKRRPGEPPEAGNDVVLRVPGDDALSARISRRHLEIHRQGDGFVAIDVSKAGTLLNGQPLPRGVAAPLAAGDRLVVAGVLTLEVDLSGAAGRAAGSEVTFPLDGATPARVVLEATVGDMVTTE